VAVDRPVKQGEEKQADFINCTAWGKTAEFVSKYFTKGQRIALTGTIRTGSYTDKEGTKRYTFDVWVNNVEFCESKKQGQTAATADQGNSGSIDIAVENIPTDDDLPF
jgi:single-strand DNA-binding protein